jgi:hypothetical protein
MTWSTRKAVKLIRETKESQPCVDCHLYYRSFQMEFDHVPERGPKLHVLGSRKARYLDEVTLRREMAKCETRCRNCHSFQTWYRMYRPGLRPPASQFGGRNLPFGASLVPWTKTNVVLPQQKVQGSRAHVSSQSLPARTNPSTLGISRLRSR